jgi:hypothetical protein
MAFAKDVANNCKYAEDFQQVMELTLKAELSNLEISSEEKLLASDFANGLASQVYEEKSKVDRLVMKYILCLV